ncbi:HAD-like protein [Gonapodya prolifera JEL478]|uniref:HAD-like protein n=1 Tax=Gonapodya prolifera (strain JEL478) TaxID=1344416 RepID=A0A139AAE1_GONPJ|nr:HAD-like protein [Gonapodya prolifera JEL478]|eukprot:KXS13624.1 HAD-like protein [Gonapodya prolifera JEL478]
MPPDTPHTGALAETPALADSNSHPSHPSHPAPPSLDSIPARAVALVASDVDGTLLAPDHSLHPLTRAAVARLRRSHPHVPFVICTGKPHASCAWIRDELDLHDMPAVHLNGCNVYVDGDLVWDKGLDGEVVHNLATDLSTGVEVSPGKVVAASVMLYVRNRVYRVVSVPPAPRANDDHHDHDGRPRRDFQLELKGYGEDVVADTQYAGEYGGKPESDGRWDLLALVRRGLVTVNKIVVCVPEEDADALRTYLLTHANSTYTVTQALGFALELIPPSVSKGAALEVLLSRLSLSWDHVMAFGDAENDVSMLSRARYGVAMANATRAASEVAAFGTRRNVEGGVGWALERVFREGEGEGQDGWVDG